MKTQSAKYILSKENNSCIKNSTLMDSQVLNILLDLAGKYKNKCLQLSNDIDSLFILYYCETVVLKSKYD